jgi:nicotinamide riboside kinase
MPNPKVDAATRTGIREIKGQLDLLNAKLKRYECDLTLCPPTGCKYVSDGLRLSQEVEILRKQNTELIEENRALKRQLSCRQTTA